MNDNRYIFLFSVLFLVLPCKSQTVFPGLQGGYTYGKIHRYELGANLYFSYRRAYPTMGPLHTFGLSASATPLVVKNVTYIGQQYLLTYHYIGFNNLMCYRMNIGFENNPDKDHRLGSEIGLSWMGLGGYAGYYFPTGTYENLEISRFRFGIRFVFNLATVIEVFKNY